MIKQTGKIRNRISSSSLYLRAAGMAVGIFAFVWWCVLYPELCFPQDTYEAVYETGKEAEEGLSADGEMKEDTDVSEKENCRRLLQADDEQVIVKSRLLEWLGQYQGEKKF